jgi:hypothetical protein
VIETGDIAIEVPMPIIRDERVGLHFGNGEILGVVIQRKRGKVTRGQCIVR